MNTSNRLGLTLLEMVTVVFIFLVLLSLLLPAVRNAKGAGYRTQCLNNQRNIAVAILNYASSNRNRLPAQGYYPICAGSESSIPEVHEGHSWAVELLPYGASDDTYVRWDFTEAWNSGSNKKLAFQRRDYLTCPEDPSSFVVEGGLSYALNCGIGDRNWIASVGPKPDGQLESGHHFMVEPFDWDGDGILPPEDLEDAAITRDFGVFWPQFGSPSDGDKDGLRYQRHVIGEIYDGSGNTIMLGENINAGMRPRAKTPSWADPHIGSSGLVLPVDARKIGKTIHGDDGSLADIVVTTPNNPAINHALNATEGSAPFPNSNHPGVSVFSFCDGSARTLSEDIDMMVYARLVTPCGTREREVAGFVPERPLTAEQF